MGRIHFLREKFRPVRHLEKSAEMAVNPLFSSTKKRAEKCHLQRFFQKCIAAKPPFSKLCAPFHPLPDGSIVGSADNQAAPCGTGIMAGPHESSAP
jgi:hypothetical protein